MLEIRHANGEEMSILSFRKLMLSVFLIYNALYFFIEINLIKNDEYSKWHIAIIGLHFVLIGSYLFLLTKLYKDLKPNGKTDLLFFNMMILFLFMISAIAMNPELLSSSIKMSANLPKIVSLIVAVLISRFYWMSKSLMSRKELVFNILFHLALIYLAFALKQFVYYFIVFKLIHFTYYHCHPIGNLHSRFRKNAYFVFQLVANISLLCMYGHFRIEYATVYVCIQLVIIYYLHVLQKNYDKNLT